MTIRVPQYQTPNPLDLLFFAYDDAARRLGLPDGFIQINLELASRLDVPAVKQAVAALHRVYPATASRVVRSAVRGLPRWQLDVEPPDLDRVVRVCPLYPSTEEELRRQVDRLMRTRLDAANRPPLQFHLFTGLARGDELVIRWPHALMDARGGFLIAEEIDRLYGQQPDLDALTSLGDEHRDDFTRLTRTCRRPTRVAEPYTPEVALPHPGDLSQLGPVQLLIRRLSADQLSQTRDACQQLCPSVRFGAFLRAVAIRALQQLVPPRRRSYYSVGCLIEGREPPYRTPVCRNLFSAGRIRLPAELASNPVAAASMIHDQTTHLADRGLNTATVSAAARLARLPPSILAALVRRSFIHGPWGQQRGDMSSPPSIPLGFLRAFSREMPTFCGTELSRAYFFRPPQPMDGLPILITVDRGQLTICGPCFESRTRLMGEFLDLLVQRLLTRE